MIKNRVSLKKIVVKGRNQNREILKLSQSFIIKNVVKNEFGFSFCIKVEDAKIVKKILKADGYEIITQQGLGFLYFLKNRFVRLGVLIGIVFCAIAFIMSNFFILQINISGNDKLQADVVLQKINSYNIDLFTPKNKINIKELEKKLKNDFPEISMISIIMRGSSLVLSIKETVINDEYNNQDSFEPIISSYNGKIEKIELIQGTLNVKVGDIIKEGQILVFPYIIDTNGVQKKVKPKANMEFTMWWEQTATFYEEYMTTVRTGKKLTIRKVYFLGLELLSNGKNNTFTEYEKEKKQIKFSSTALPLIKVEETIFETKNVRVVQVFDENEKNKIIQTIKRTLLPKCENYEIIKEWSKVKAGAGVFHITYVIETRGTLKFNFEE